MSCCKRFVCRSKTLELAPKGYSKIFGTWIEKLLESPSQREASNMKPDLDNVYRFTTKTWTSLDEYQHLFDEEPSSRMLFHAPSLEVADEIKNSDTWKTLTSIDQDTGAAMMHDTLVIRWMNNCLFTTKSGRLGMASAGLQVGDQSRGANFWILAANDCKT